VSTRVQILTSQPRNVDWPNDWPQEAYLRRKTLGNMTREAATQGLLPSRRAFLPASKGHGADHKSTVWISRQWLCSFLGVFRKQSND